MNELIHWCAVRVGSLLRPGSGRRRAGRPAARGRSAWAPPSSAGWETPYLRSCRPERTLDGDASRLVCPYVVAAEQAERRAALGLALDGADVPGPMWIHGMQVGAA